MRGGGADHFDPPDGAPRDDDHVAGGQNGRLAVQAHFQKPGDDRIDPVAVLRLCRDDGAGRPGVGGCLISTGLQLLPERRLAERTVPPGIPPLDPHQHDHADSPGVLRPPRTDVRTNARGVGHCGAAHAVLVRSVRDQGARATPWSAVRAGSTRSRSAYSLGEPVAWLYGPTRNTADSTLVFLSADGSSGRVRQSRSTWKYTSR